MKHTHHPDTSHTRLLASGALLAALVAPAAMAATITVDPTAADDATAADGKCSLREAVISINTGGSMGDCTANVTEAFGVNDTIVLPAGTYTLTRQGIDETYSDSSPGDPGSAPVVVNTPDATRGDLDLQKKREDPGRRYRQHDHRMGCGARG